MHGGARTRYHNTRYHYAALLGLHKVLKLSITFWLLNLYCCLTHQKINNLNTFVFAFSLADIPNVLILTVPHILPSGKVGCSNDALNRIKEAFSEAVDMTFTQTQSHKWVLWISRLMWIHTSAMISNEQVFSNNNRHLPLLWVRICSLIERIKVRKT